MKRQTRLSLLILILLGGAALGWHLHVQRTARAAFVSELNTLEAAAAARLGSTEPRPLTRDNPERAQLFAIRAVYDEMSPRQRLTPATLRALRQLGDGLVSSNEIVRETTGDLVRHLLSAWIRHEAPLMREREVQAFFRFYAHVGSRSLREFLRAQADGPEAKFLNELGS